MKQLVEGVLKCRKRPVRVRKEVYRWGSAGVLDRFCHLGRDPVSLHRLRPQGECLTISEVRAIALQLRKRAEADARPIRERVFRSGPSASTVLAYSPGRVLPHTVAREHGTPAARDPEYALLIQSGVGRDRCANPDPEYALLFQSGVGGHAQQIALCQHAKRMWRGRVRPGLPAGLRREVG